MSTVAPFGLYPTRSLVAGQRVSAGQVFTLDTPVGEGGVTLFRQSFWLAVPMSARGASSLRLAASALTLRFDPVTLPVPTDDPHWFDKVVTGTDDKTVRIEFAWPATVTELPDPSPAQRGVAFDLFRADGERQADAPTMSGRTSQALDPHWIGTPMLVVMRQPVHEAAPIRSKEIALRSAGPAASAMARAGAAAAPAVPGPSSPVAVKEARAAKVRTRQRSHVVPTVMLRGVPTSPRAKLIAEARGGAAETLLWQALLPAEQSTVSLPQQAVGDEWAPALEQVRQRLAGESPALDTPLLLRLDIESDAPCQLTVTQATLALDGEFEGLADELRVDFDGTRVQSLPLPLNVPAGAVLQGLRLSGRVGGGGVAAADAAGPLPADLRRGLLLAGADRVLVHAVLDAPARLGGLAMAWHPLSDAVALTLRLLADAGDAPSAVPLRALSLRADTPAPGWLALRSEAFDLQAQHLWLELTLDDGSGLWLADAHAPVPTQGFREQRDTRWPQRQPLGLQPAFGWLPPPLPTPPAGMPPPPRRVGLVSGDQVLAAELSPRFELDCPEGLLPTVASQGLRARSGSAAQLSLVSALARVRLA